MRRRLGVCVVVAACSGGEGPTDAAVDAGASEAGAPAGGAFGGQPSGGEGGSTGGSTAGGSTAGGSSVGGAAGVGATAGIGATGGAGANGGAPHGGGAGGASGSAGATGAGGTATLVDEPCDATCHFVRAGASGALDGTSWADAWTELPATLERGHRYYVAAGTYPGYVFDDPASGTESIEVIKATDARRGADDGWDPAFGVGVADFGTLSFQTAYVTFDGTDGLGFRAVGGFQGSVVEIAGDHVTVRHVDIDGAFGTDTSGNHDAGACTGMSIGGSSVLVQACEIHDVADDGVSASGIDDLELRGNVIHALHACGTDGGCGPCYNGHSDGIEIFDVVRSRLIGNFVYDVRSTATVFFGNWADSLGNGPSDYCEDIVIANNVFYEPNVGLVAYVQDVSGVEIYHNVFWGLRQGSYGGLSIGPNVTGLRLLNNIILSVNTAHTGGAYDPAEHESDYNLFGSDTGQWTLGPNSVQNADPGFVGIPGRDGPAVDAPNPGDFALVAGSPAENAGTTDMALPTDDFVGRARDASPDLGAFER